MTTPLRKDPSRGASASSYVVGGGLVRQALRALAQRKGRAALTAFSVASGVAAVVWRPCWPPKKLRSNYALEEDEMRTQLFLPENVATPTGIEPVLPT